MIVYIISLLNKQRKNVKTRTIPQCTKDKHKSATHCVVNMNEKNVINEVLGFVYPIYDCYFVEYSE